MKTIEAHEKEVPHLTALDESKNVQERSDTTTKTLYSIDPNFKRLVDYNAITQKTLDEKKLDEFLRWLSSVPSTLHHDMITDERMLDSGN